MNLHVATQHLLLEHSRRKSTFAVCEEDAIMKGSNLQWRLHNLLDVADAVVIRFVILLEKSAESADRVYNAAAVTAAEQLKCSSDS